MKIQCVLVRPGGTKVELGGFEYHFEPLSDGAHVAEVLKEEHIDRFLAIPEGYKVYHGNENPTGKPVESSSHEVQSAKIEKANKKPEVLKSSTEHPPQFDINGVTYSLGDVTRKAFAASGLSEDEWNELGEDEIAAKIDITLDDMADAVDERASLVEQYVAKFGNKPHHKASIETIKAKLAE